MRHVFAFPFLALALGCTSGEVPIGASVVDAAADTNKPDSALADTGAVLDSSGPIAEDTGSPVLDSAEPDTTVEEAAVDAPPLGPIDCWSGTYGTPSGSLVDFFYQQQVGGCESSACSDFVLFDAATCVMTLQVADVKYPATLDSGDCFIFKRWLTGDVLISRLNDTTTCYYGKGGSGTYEATTVTLAEGIAQKKTWMCGDEPFVSHRRCIQSFRAKYFPGK